ncbi:MAG TPA: hypothetical protein VGP47_07585 [Parachlamydiaceae bacterium]|nr:hypothetical protein [Parachlamydiaceae bacterium]
MTDPKDQDEEKRKQIMRIHKLATRLPWIIVGVSLFAFLIIFLQVYFMRS